MKTFKPERCADAKTLHREDSAAGLRAEMKILFICGKRWIP